MAGWPRHLGGEQTLPAYASGTGTRGLDWGSCVYAWLRFSKWTCPTTALLGGLFKFKGHMERIRLTICLQEESHAVLQKPLEGSYGTEHTGQVWRSRWGEKGGGNPKEMIYPCGQQGRPEEEMGSQPHSSTRWWGKEREREHPGFSLVKG